MSVKVWAESAVAWRGERRRSGEPPTWLLTAAAAFLAFLVVLFPAPSYAQSSASPYTSGYRWDGERQLVGEISAPVDAAVPGAGPYQAVRYTYNADGQLAKIEKGSLAAWQAQGVAPAAWSGFTVLRVTDVAYDAAGNKLRETVSAGGVVQAITQYAYDADDRVSCTMVRMDLAGPAADACTPGAAGSFGADRVTRNVYDVASQLVQVRKAVGGVRAPEQAYVTYSYTPNGKQEYVLDANGNRAKMEYDGFDRQAKWLFPATSAPAAYNPATQTTALASAGAVNLADYEQYGYDAGGNRLSLRKRDGTSLGFTYDAVNRVTVKTVPDTRAPVLATTHTRDVFYAYDQRGLQTAARFDGAASGEGIFTSYDKAGRVASGTLALDGASRTVWTCFDANSNRSRTSFPDSATGGGNCATTWTNAVDYTYDGLNRARTVSAGSPAWTRTWSYDAPSGDLTNEATSGGAGAVTFGRDAIGRLAALTRDLAGTTSDSAIGFGYNAASQIVSESRSNDAYAYRGRANLNLGYSPNGLNQYAAVGGAGYCYDANGNLTADDQYVYLYDVENRLVAKRDRGVGNTSCTALSYANTLRASLRYDPAGRLYETVGPVTGTTRFMTDGDAVVVEYDAAGNLLRRYVHGADGKADDPIAWYEGGTFASGALRFLGANQQGSIVVASDAAGNALRLFAYDEYGIAEARDGAALTPANGARFLYTGQMLLPDAGVYHYKARAYSATLGRFLQTDPIGYDDQINLYAYVANDPVNGRDPTGLECNKEGTSCTSNNYTAGRVPINVSHDAKVDAAVIGARGQFASATRQGGEPTGRADVTASGVTVTSTASRAGTTSDADTAKFSVTGAAAAVHGHLSGSVTDVPGANKGYGDTQSLGLKTPIPTYTVEGNRVGVHDAPNGQIRFEMVQGTMTRAEQREIQRNLDREQRTFDKRFNPGN